jgi:ankyrin repeat protein
MSRQLFKAVRSGKVLPVREALAAGADPNTRLVKSGMTALSEALTCGRVDVARALIDCGADVNALDGDGCRPLDVALLYAGRPGVRLLIERGAEVNYVAHDGDTGLMAAAGFGDVALVEIFLAAGADPNVAREVDGLTVADIQVCAINSQDAPAGMRKSSQRILDVLAARGATVHSPDQIAAIKNSHGRSQERPETTSRGVFSRPSS